MKLALDLSSTATGWALGGGRRPGSWGAIIPPTKYALPNRLVYIVDLLTALADEQKVDEVYCEELHYLRGMPAVRALAGLRGAVIYVFAKRGVPVYFRHQKQGYVAMGLKGNAKKGEVVRRAQALGFDTDNDNVADAIAVYLGSNA